jgi:alpha-1,6-mannosyltransferase
MIGGGAVAALTLLSVAMAAAGPEVLPAARNDDPGWLRGIYGEGLGIGGDLYLGLEQLALLLYVLVLLCATALAPRLLWAAAAASVLAFALAPPLLSLDVFSYASYARLEALHGLNPYEHAPAAVPGDEAVGFVQDFRETTSTYGPLFTLGSTPLAHLGLPGFVWTMKALAGGAVLATAWAASRLASTRGLDPRPAAALIALNPLVLVHVVGGAHNDALMALLLIAGVAGIVAGREALGGAGLVAGAAVKAAGAVPLPFALVEGRDRSRLIAGIGVAAIVLVALGLGLYGSAVDSALSVASTNQDLASRASLPSTVSDAFGIGLDPVRIVALGLYAALVAGLLAWTARGADWVRAAGWAGVGVLLASSYLTPWYVIWALPLAAIARDRALVASTVLVTAFLLRHQVPGLGG